MFEYIVKCDIDGHHKLLSITAESVDRAMICLSDKYGDIPITGLQDMFKYKSTPEKVRLFNSMVSNINISDIFISLIQLFATDTINILDEG